MAKVIGMFGDNDPPYKIVFNNTKDEAAVSALKEEHIPIELDNILELYLAKQFARIITEKAVLLGGKRKK